MANRLQGVYAAAGMDAGELDALVCGEALRELRRAASPDALALLGAAVADADGDIAEVELDQESMLAREAFRRFASDVVAPLAEKIHREDLTVPETLLV